MLRPLAALSLLALCAPASAGVVMEFTDTSAGVAPSRSKAYVGADRVRVESAGNILIFRGDKDVLWAIDTQAKTYTELTREGMAGMADMMKQMESQLAGLPPEQRAMVEAMMKKQAPAGEPKAAEAPVSWSANGTSDTVGGRTCKGYDGVRGGKLDQRICTVDWATFGLTRDDLRAFEDLAKFMAAMGGPMAQQARGTMLDAAMPGIPLRSVIPSAQGEQVHEVTKIEKADVPASLFEIPAGLTAQSMGGD